VSRARAAAAVVLALLVPVGCGDETLGAATVGARLLADPSLSTSPTNAFACATCHPVTVVPPGDTGPALGAVRHTGPMYPGGNLFDSVHRGSWWGGGETRLLDAIDYCLVEFMAGGALSAADDRARAIYEYLAAVSPDDPTPALPLTVVKNVNDLAALAPTADAGRGGDVYDRACRGCHGAAHTGEGRIGSKASVVPEDTVNGPVCMPRGGSPPGGDVGTCARAVLVEKVRHGKFFNIGGIMPLYSAERLSDPEIADILAYVGL
jgi:thiosulfate dehydrogenase